MAPREARRRAEGGLRWVGAVVLAAACFLAPRASSADEAWEVRLASARESLVDLRSRAEAAERAEIAAYAAAARARATDRSALEGASQAIAAEVVRRASDEVDRAGARVVAELRRAQEGDDALLAIEGWPLAREAPPGEAGRLASLEGEREELDRELRRHALASARRHEVAAVEANDLRVAAIAAAPRPEAITSPGGEGWEQAEGELLLARRRIQLRLVEGAALLHGGFAGLRDPATSFRLAALAVEIALAFVGLRLLRALLGVLARPPVFEGRARRTGLSRLHELAADALRAGQGPLSAFLGVLLLGWLLGSDAEGPFVAASLHAALWMTGAVALATIVEALFEGASSLVEDDDEEESDTRRAKPRVDLPGLAEGRERALHRAAITASSWIAATSVLEMLAGDGVLAAWADTVAWIVAPLLVAWLAWTLRHAVTARLDRLARDNPESRLLVWIAANRRKWWRFFPLSIGVLVVGAWTVTGWAVEQVSSFDVTRRGLAWAFRRRVGARADTLAGCSPLDDASAATFRPEGPPLRTLSRVDRHVVDRLAAAIREGKGGIFAIVGERGLGKSAILTRITQGVGDTSILQAVVRRGGDPVADVRTEMHADPDTALEVLAERIEESPYAAVFLDDVHRAVAPRVGGLEAFDALVAIARAASRETLWLFTFERTSWEFIARARESEPIFDEIFVLEPWSEADIAQLVRSRTAVARIKPSFAGLTGASATPLRGPGALRAETDFYRTLWDYSLGNPAVALLFWRASLFTEAGGGARVRLFHAPEPDELEGLPDDARFVLRALVQLEHADPEEIRRATLLDPREVASALRIASHRGLVEPVAGDLHGRLRITWTYYRAVTRFLRRKHLLTTA